MGWQGVPFPYARNVKLWLRLWGIVVGSGEVGALEQPKEHVWTKLLTKVQELGDNKRDNIIWTKLCLKNNLNKKCLSTYHVYEWHSHCFKEGFPRRLVLFVFESILNKKILIFRRRPLFFVRCILREYEWGWV